MKVSWLILLVVITLGKARQKSKIKNLFAALRRKLFKIYFWFYMLVKEVIVLVYICFLCRFLKDISIFPPASRAYISPPPKYYDYSPPKFKTQSQNSAPIVVI